MLYTSLAYKLSLNLKPDTQHTQQETLTCNGNGKAPLTVVLHNL